MAPTTSSAVNLWQKRLRAQVIAAHLKELGQTKCVCFSCGNTAKELMKAGLEVVYVGPGGGLTPNYWYTYTDVQRTFNGLFDATSGHLPLPLMVEVAERMRYEMLDNKGLQALPRQILTGSGETFVCMSLAYPNIPFEPVRDDTPATEYNEYAPLNGLVQLITRANVQSRK